MVSRKGHLRFEGFKCGVGSGVRGPLLAGLLALFGLVLLPGFAMAAISPGQVNFSTTAPGETSEARTVTLTNQTGSPLTVALSLNNQAVNFAFDDDSCPAQLLADQSCQITVYFKPTAVGTFYSELSVTGTSYYTALVGSTPLPSGTIDPATDQDFGFVADGSSTTKHFTITSNGSGPLPIAEVRATGMDSSDFIVEDSDCDGDLASGSSCGFDVRFKPLSSHSTSREALLVVFDGNGNALLLVGLRGSTSIADYTITPDRADFGEAVIGSGLSRTPTKFTIASTGGSPLPYVGSEILGPEAGSYVIDDNCPSSILPGQSCSAEVRFNPESGVPGTRIVGLNLKAGINEQSYKTLILQGTAVAAPTPPAGKSKLKLKLGPTRFLKRSGKVVIKATVTNRGDATASPVTLAAKAPKKFAAKIAPIKVSSLSPGQSVSRKIRIKLKTNANGSRKFKVIVTATATGTVAVAKRRIRVR